MIQINIIPSLVINQNGLFAKDKSGKLVDICLHQGSLDGACSVYSVFMNLLILKVISYNDIKVYEKSNDPETRKLCKKLLEENGMHHNGQYLSTIRKILNESIGSQISAKDPRATQREVIPQIVDHLKRDYPVIISVGFRGGKDAHALLCVGYEGSDEYPSKLFCLDPDTPKTFNNYWNTVIDLEANSNNRKYFSRYIPNELNTEYDVSLDDILLITPKE